MEIDPSWRTPVLVTGAAGFIGRRVVARLLEAGQTPRALLLPGEQAPVGWEGRVDIVRGDVRDADAVDDAVAGVGTVVHLAALVAEANDDYEAHWAVTAQGSRHVYAAAARAGARVVVTTSICAYGDAIARGVCSEDTPRGAFQGPYGRAKQAQEDFAVEAQRETGLAVTILRPSNVYGVGSGPWVEMFAAMLGSGEMAVIGRGDENAGLVHVENVVDALLLAAADDDGAALGRVYNVCDGLDVTWRRYVDDLAAALGVASPPSLPRDPLHAAALANEDPAALRGPADATLPPLELINLVASDNRFDTARIRSELGWVPRVGYDEALAEIAASLRER